MLYTRFFMPILALARTKPIVRTIVPPMSLDCAPKTCSTRERTVDFDRLLPLGRPQVPDPEAWVQDWAA